MSFGRVMALGAGAVAFAAFAALGLLWLWHAGSAARGLLEGLGLPPDAREVSAVEVQGPDGSMPEIATRTFRISWPLETLQRFYVEACERAGFVEASAEGVRVEPELLCERWRTGGRDAVSLAAECRGGECRATLVVRSLQM